jgi:hypothetical protein
MLLVRVIIISNDGKITKKDLCGFCKQDNFRGNMSPYTGNKRYMHANGTIIEVEQGDINQFFWTNRRDRHAFGNMIHKYFDAYFIPRITIGNESVEDLKKIEKSLRENWQTDHEHVNKKQKTTQ